MFVFDLHFKEMITSKDFKRASDDGFWGDWDVVEAKYRTEEKARLALEQGRILTTKLPSGRIIYGIPPP